MFPTARFSRSRNPQVRLSVCGKSGDAKPTKDRSPATLPDDDSDTACHPSGVGKSWLCSRLVFPKHDAFAEITLESAAAGQEAHSSNLTRGEFFTEAISNDHFLYFGKTNVSVTADAAAAGSNRELKAELYVVEQTEFLDVNTGLVAFHTLGPADKPYAERAAKKTLKPACPPKRQYINHRHVVAQNTGNQFEAFGQEQVGEDFPQPFLVDVHALVYDATVDFKSPLYREQKMLLTTLLQALLLNGRRVLFVVTKCDLVSGYCGQQAIDAIESICELLNVAKRPPVVSVSAKDDVNMDVLTQTIVNCALGIKVDREAVVQYPEAVVASEEKISQSLKDLEKLIDQDDKRGEVSWNDFFFRHYQSKCLLHLLDKLGRKRVEELAMPTIERLSSAHQGDTTTDGTADLPDHPAAVRERLPPKPSARPTPKPRRQTQSERKGSMPMAGRRTDPMTQSLPPDLIRGMQRRHFRATNPVLPPPPGDVGEPSVFSDASSCSPVKPSALLPAQMTSPQEVTSPVWSLPDLRPCSPVKSLPISPVQIPSPEVVTSPIWPLPHLSNLPSDQPALRKPTRRLSSGSSPDAAKKEGQKKDEELARSSSPLQSEDSEAAGNDIAKKRCPTCGGNRQSAYQASQPTPPRRTSKPTLLLSQPSLFRTPVDEIFTPPIVVPEALDAGKLQRSHSNAYLLPSDLLNLTESGSPDDSREMPSSLPREDPESFEMLPDARQVPFVESGRGEVRPPNIPGRKEERPYDSHFFPPPLPIRQPRDRTGALSNDTRHRPTPAAQSGPPQIQEPVYTSIQSGSVDNDSMDPLSPTGLPLSDLLIDRLRAIGPSVSDASRGSFMSQDPSVDVLMTSNRSLLTDLVYLGASTDTLGYAQLRPGPELPSPKTPLP